MIYNRVMKENEDGLLVDTKRRIQIEEGILPRTGDQIHIVDIVDFDRNRKNRKCFLNLDRTNVGIRGTIETEVDRMIHEMEII